MLFDDQFRFVAGGADPVNPNGGYKLHDAFINSPVHVTKSGYLFVYCSNESNINVFFDNLQITHVQGHLQQEDTYYPYGMGIAVNLMYLNTEKEYQKTEAWCTWIPEYQLQTAARFGFYNR